MPKRDLISIHDLTRQEVKGLFALSGVVKREPERFRSALRGKILAMIFQKSSTRTRVSFEAAMLQLGGHGLFLSGRELQLGRGETVADTARVLSRYVDAIMARTYAHSDLVELAVHASVPVVNGLSDDLHPCQALADLFTLQEIFGDLGGRKLAYIGDGNNVARSLLFAAAKVGLHVALASPPGYEVRGEYLELARRDAQETGAEFSLTTDPLQAVAGASAVYTDVWASMGQEEESEERLRSFAGYSVDGSLMARARREAIFLHCLPCHRGEEVTAEVADGPQSRIFDQAENRLHAQKALLLWLLGGATL